MIIIYVILIIVGFLGIMQNKNMILYGDRYIHTDNIKFCNILQALQVLEEANVGGYFYLDVKGGFYKTFILKNQNEEEWWYELVIRKNNIPKINMLLNIEKNNKYLDCYPSNCIMNIKNKNRYYLGSNKEEVMKFLDKYFSEAFDVNDLKKYKTLFNKENDLVKIAFHYIYTTRRFDISTI